MTRLQALQARVAGLEELVRNCKCKDKVKVHRAGLVKHEEISKSSSSGSDEEQTKKAREIQGGSRVAGTEDSGVKDTTAKATPKGVWKCIGGSRFWRPNGAAVRAVATEEEKSDGFWVMEGSSKFWRNNRVAGQADGKWKVARGGGRQDKYEGKGQHICLENRFSILIDMEQGEDVRHLVIGDSRVRPLRRNNCSNCLLYTSPSPRD